MYDDIASLYHLIYPDWEAAIALQSRAYFDTASSVLGAAPNRVLDVSCGIGTQALGLAKLGCTVAASDISAGAVARARREAQERDLAISFHVSDMQDCFSAHGGEFDLVVSADNSVPHLTAPQIARAFQGMYRCLRPGGVVLIGVRDYQPEEERSKGQVFSYGTRDCGDERYVVFQTRDWEGASYDVGMYFVREVADGVPADVIAGKSRYHAISIGTLLSILTEVGFQSVQRHDNVTHNVLLSGTVGGT